MIKIKNREVEGIDFIGDVHGHYNALVKLLQMLGYEQKKDFYFHPERIAFFVGDYIDRGPKIVETLELVYKMTENDAAIALMGNHEYNAVGFNLPDSNGGYKRPHLIKNYLQHHETLSQFKNRQNRYDDYVDWFKTLPVFYEHELFRAAHAAWDEKAISFIQEHCGETNIIPEHSWNDAADIDGILFDPLEIILKGRELSLPNGQTFVDKDGHNRAEIRVKWWENPKFNSMRSMSILPLDGLSNEPLDVFQEDFNYYTEDQLPVFFGHYWLKDQPNLYRENICCLDYSIAKGGLLAAYRFDGEQQLNNSKFVAVK